jgi:hypothetical protein
MPTKFWPENLKSIDSLEHLGVHGKIILKQTLKNKRREMSVIPT